MIYTYGITQVGFYHSIDGSVCQDAHNIIKCNDEVVVAAVADGVGSEKHSDVASQIAVTTSTIYCAHKISNNVNNLDDETILNIIHKSFSISLEAIVKKACQYNDALDQYDTTLSLVVFIRDSVYYGHSGDSGIIVLTDRGLYLQATKQQRDKDGHVFPLCCSERWIFQKVPHSVASVFLATDGILDLLFPIYIRQEKVNIYIALAQYFMCAEKLHIEELGEDKVKEKIEGFISAIPKDKVNDDKTVVCLINTDIVVEKQPDNYYSQPDWDTLKNKWLENWNKIAYPHLFNKT